MNNTEVQIIGISEPKLKDLILEIYEYRDKLSKVLDEAKKIMYDTKNYYNGTDADELRRKFELFSSNFDTFLKNVKSYGEDLELVISKYKENERINVDKLF